MSARGHHGRLILRLPSWLGDFVMAEPVVRAAWEQSDGSSPGPRPLSLLGPSAFLRLFEGRFVGAARIALAGAELPEHYAGHDSALFLNGSLRSVLVAARARVPTRIGGPQKAVPELT